MSGEYWKREHVWCRRLAGVLAFVVGTGSLVALLYAVSHVVH